ncbi:Bifunctional purine biosynthesis protein PurH [Pseudobythopirellula maris]|uniref:Bifunctional purine biosynthesis protein PurH n=1 Tax=Pseudobythopirellula maris TaxID=2527991 RepID=A0A5C5ZTJ2_9BACT|nr:bifunctional phosphoribosylaminoimidazolecarboxamide formyltransferase/IMP cyclohydrolase [Pseudobythopirellula maris]TWT90832.1 Bifunctional purine biosynthesis protein PurH [Pseudobythopirellula maris]
MAAADTEAPIQRLIDSGASPKIERALLSVSDKTGLEAFGKRLAELGVELFSTGGTRRCLEQAGVAVRDVADYTGYPEMMDGRVKTLHPRVHGGLLGRRDQAGDMASAEEHGIVPFELVVVNLYPFEETIAREGVTVAEAIEQIDIGGPSMVRSSAKNHAFVTVAGKASQYDEILQQIESSGATTPELRRRLAGEAFAQTAAYDTAIAAYFAGLEGGEGADADAVFPPRLTSDMRRKATLRYGENPHQAASLYVDPQAGPHALVNAEILNGKELSYNNLLDLDAALACARSLPAPGVAVLKHNNPCGAATATTVGEATERAWAGDPVSAFGSILGFNAEVDAAAAECLAEPGKFVEAIVAPGYSAEALEILTTKPKWKANVRLLQVGAVEPGDGAPLVRTIDGGCLVQQADDQPDPEAEWRVVTDTKPTDEQLAELRFAWAACRHVKSNAIVLSSNGALVGVGAGQMSRVDSVEIAIRKAGDRSTGSVLASDAFFPFDDGVRTAHAAGVTAIIQPGGSRGDESVIAACNELGVPMVFTGRRHFRH